MPPSLASSQQDVDQTVLFQAVTKFIEEKPQLKLEDQQVLRIDWTKPEPKQQKPKFKQCPKCHQRWDLNMVVCPDEDEKVQLV